MHVNFLLVNAVLEIINMTYDKTITEGSGIGSGHACRVIPWTDTRAQKISREYPFVGGRTPHGMNWVAVEMEDGTIDTFPKGRVR
jgi:hypothetical protein